MKKIAVILVIFLCASLHILSVHAQTMRFYKPDGNVLSYDLDSISSITFNGDSTQLAQYEMRIYPNSIWGTNPYGFPVGPGDSLTVWKDSIGEDILSVFIGMFDIPGLQEYRYNITKIDSISVESRFGQLDTNSNVVTLPRGIDTIGNRGDFVFPIWNGNRIYSTYPLHFFELDSSLRIIIDSTFKPLFVPYIMSMNSTGDRMLYILSTSSEYSIGRMFEWNLTTNVRQPIDTTPVFSNAIYLSGTDNIMYYSYGSYSKSNTNPSDAGYYLLDRASGTRTLVLHYISNLGPKEMVNGFDISSDGSKLLIPEARSNSEPIAVEYNFITHMFDTIGVTFDSTALGIRPALWLRYNHDASKILYCNYPFGSISRNDYPSNISEVGIIVKHNRTKQILRTNPVNIYVGISLFPAWSPDENKIVYSCTKLAGNGSIAFGHQVCILTNLQ